MPRPHPPEFRQRAVELARLREKPIAEIAHDLGIAESCLRTWVKQADIDDGRRHALSSDERSELVQLRRDLRGRRLRGAGLLGSMGTVGDCFDNSVAESFFGTLQLELLDEHHWETRQQLALAIFEWIEAWYNPKRRHSYCNMLSPVDYEAAHAA